MGCMTPRVCENCAYPDEELVLVRRDMSLDAVARIARIDAWYGVLAGAIVVVGFSRAIFAMQ